jgi:Cu/Ag efflux protein CusF
VKNLAQVKVGDTLTVQYTEALRLKFTTGGALRQKTESSDSMRAASGARPGAAAAREVQFVADVTAVDAKTGALTLRGPERTLDVTVKDKAALKNVKVGDQVEGTFLQVAAIAVEPPAKK